MKIFIIFTCIFGVLCEVYLRPRNDRGPGTCFRCLNLHKIILTSNQYFEGAARTGVSCIEKIERIFFKNKNSQQVQNIGVYHTKTSSSPSSEIEFYYLSDLHRRIFEQEQGEDAFQLKVISDMTIKQLGTISTFSDVTLTDCYVIIGDNETKVSPTNIIQI